MSELDWIALEYSQVCLAQLPGVAVLSKWRPVVGDAVWMLRLRLELTGAEPTALLPAETEWELVIDFAADPWGKVQIHPALDEKGLAATFEHQQFNGAPHPVWPCRNGHICTASWLQGLAGSRNAHAPEPASTIDRLCWHVARASEWLTLAASDALTQTGDPYELPDFNVKTTALNSALAYYEDAGTYQHWQEHDERSGIVELTSLGAALFPRRFYDERGRTLLYEPAWGEYISQQRMVRKAIWVRLGAVPVLNRWQVPITWASLRAILEQQQTDLLAHVGRPLAHLQEAGEWLLLLGMPIPRQIGGALYRYHWQALQLLPASGKASPKSRIELAKNRLGSDSAINWSATATNWHPEDLQNRGQLTSDLRAARVVLLGAGALGSALAEQLVRMGLQNLTLVDDDLLEPGNLVRHTLMISDLYQPKAKTLATRLNQLNPSARVVGLITTVPTKDAVLEAAIAGATLIIDATASDGALKAVPFTGADPRVPFISCSLGLNAERLFFYAALSGQFDWANFNGWFNPFRTEENQLANQIDLPRGVGCWHALVPARLNRVTGLAGIAVELIEQYYCTPAPSPVKLCYSWPSPLLPLPFVNE